MIEISELHYRLHCAVELVRMIHSSITEGVNNPTMDDWDGLFAAYLLLASIDKEMEAKIESELSKPVSNIM